MFLFLFGAVAGVLFAAMVAVALSSIHTMNRQARAAGAFRGAGR